MKFEEIISLKDKIEKNEKLKEWYKNNIQVSKWLNNPYKNTIIRFHDRTEYKKFGKYHRLNGPAIEYFNNEKLNEYYYKGKKYNKNEWTIITKKETRKLKLKRLSK